MLRVFPVPLEVRLPSDEILDLFLIQWHSPAPLQAGTPGKLPADLVARRAQLLQDFSRWLAESYFPACPKRPVFVVAPELSVSLTHVELLAGILSAAGRPGFVIVGLEFLDWAEYRTLVEGMEHMPDAASWLAEGHSEHRINAALILVRDDTGAVRRFIQPKRNPSDPEAKTHFPCRNVLLFQSCDQKQGSRLNFCVQICADFTNHALVREFRQACEISSPGRPIDLTFVLQRNEDQSAAQFKKSVEAYFAPPAGMVDTEPGCLVFLNNAREASEAGPKWGDSMLLFPYKRNWRTFGAHTYWLKDDKAHNHQCVVMRESGPAVFLLRYRPQYLVNPIAGSGQPGPFADNHALSVPLVDEVFPKSAHFLPIPPVFHWLRAEWGEGRADFEAQLESAGLADGVRELCSVAYDEVLHAWEFALSVDDSLPRMAMELYFCCFAEQGYPRKTLEPREWGHPVAEGSRRFLAVFALLQVGLAGESLLPNPCQTAHAQIPGKAELTLIWGSNMRPARAMVTAALERLAQAGAQGHGRRVVILVCPLDIPTPEQLSRLVNAQSEDVTQPKRPVEASSPDVLDDIAEAKTELVPMFICDQQIFGAVFNASSASERREGLRGLGLSF